MNAPKIDIPMAMPRIPKASEALYPKEKEPLTVKESKNRIVKNIRAVADPQSRADLPFIRAAAKPPNSALINSTHTAVGAT